MLKRGFISPPDRASGFTIIEVLLVLSMIAILAALTLPFASSLLIRHDVDIAAATFSQNLRRAQILSQSGALDSQWGVHIQTNTITLYKGTGFAVRDTSFDEITNTSSGLIVSGDTDITFSKILGDPSGPKTVTITKGDESLVIALNGRGLVSY